jgi:hypothetical protein
MRSLGQDNQCPGQRSSWVLTEYMSQVLLLETSCLANAGNDKQIVIFDKCFGLVHTEQRGLEGIRAAGKGRGILGHNRHHPHD